jgi:hypothetical protein
VDVRRGECSSRSSQLQGTAVQRRGTGVSVRSGEGQLAIEGLCKSNNAASASVPDDTAEGGVA